MKLPENFKIADPDLNAVVDIVYSRAKEILNTPSHLHYTDHSIDHSERIIEIVNQLIVNISLKEAEKFILVCAILLHDIGMQTPKYANVTSFPLNENELEKIREKHHEFSEEMILESLVLQSDNRYYLGLDSKTEYVEDIATIAKFHRKLDITQLQDDVIGSVPIRLKLLAALIRLGDCLDMDFRRVKIDRLNVFSIPLKSKFFWYSHHYVKGITLDSLKISLTVAFPESYRSNQTITNKITEHIKKEIENQKNEVYHILDQFTIRLYPDVQINTKYSRTVKLMPDDLLNYLMSSNSNDLNVLKGNKIAPSSVNKQVFIQEIIELDTDIEKKAEDKKPKTDFLSSCQQITDDELQQSFSWIHLSDMHFKGDANDSTVWTELCNTIKNSELSECGYIFISGDIANKGDFDHADAYIKQLFDSFDSKPTVFFTPGNHDVDFDKLRNKDIKDRFRGKQYGEAYDRMQEFANNGVTRFNNGMSIEIAFKSYNEFSKKNEFDSVLQSVDEQGKSDFHYFYADDKLNLCLINTALTSIGEEDTGNLIIPLNGLTDRLTQINEKNKENPTFVIAHHPIGMLEGQTAEVLKSAFHSRIDAYFCGHTHKMDGTMLDSGDIKDKNGTEKATGFYNISTGSCMGRWLDIPNAPLGSYSFIYGTYYLGGKCKMQVYNYNRTCWSESSEIHKRMSSLNSDYYDKEQKLIIFPRLYNYSPKLPHPTNHKTIPNKSEHSLQNETSTPTSKLNMLIIDDNLQGDFNLIKEMLAQAKVLKYIEPHEISWILKNLDSTKDKTLKQFIDEKIAPIDFALVDFKFKREFPGETSGTGGVRASEMIRKAFPCCPILYTTWYFHEVRGVTILDKFQPYQLWLKGNSDDSFDVGKDKITFLIKEWTKSMLFDIKSSESSAKQCLEAIANNGEIAWDKEIFINSRKWTFENLFFIYKEELSYFYDEKNEEKLNEEKLKETILSENGLGYIPKYLMDIKKNDILKENLIDYYKLLYFKYPNEIPIIKEIVKNLLNKLKRVIELYSKNNDKLDRLKASLIRYNKIASKVPLISPDEYTAFLVFKDKLIVRLFFICAYTLFGLQAKVIYYLFIDAAVGDETVKQITTRLFIRGMKFMEKIEKGYLGYKIDDDEKYEEIPPFRRNYFKIINHSCMKYEKDFIKEYYNEIQIDLRDIDLENTNTIEALIKDL